MNVQDKLERILREMHIMLSRGTTAKEDEEFVLIHKREMQKLLGSISQTVSEMLEQYEVTEQSRNQAELEVKKHHMEIVRNANRQAEDIYAASVIYTDDALGRIQDIIEAAENSTKEVLYKLNRALEEEKRQVRSNQLELKTQLEDMKDTAKYMKIIEDRNREIAKAKAKKAEDGKPQKYERKVEEAPEFVAIKPDIKINEEYFEKAGLTPEGLPKDMMEDAANIEDIPVVEDIATIEDSSVTEDLPTIEEVANAQEEMPEEKIVYDKPEIKVNPEYFKKLEEQRAKENPEGEEAQKDEEKKEKRQGIFSFGKKS